MKISMLTFILTENCNFNCSYCSQTRTGRNLESIEIKKCLDFFFPWLDRECHFNFYGGEPLLRFQQIEEIVAWIQTRNKKAKKEISFGISTNGSLIHDKVLEFLDIHQFTVLLSFDGLAQDHGRKKGSQEPTIRVLKKLQDLKNIDLHVNSVFTPGTIGFLADSIRFIQDLGVENHDFSLAFNYEWDSGDLMIYKKQLQSLRKDLIDRYWHTHEIPLSAYRKQTGWGLFSCAAGKDRFVLDPDTSLWGCHLFANHFQGQETGQEFNRYSFGILDDFIENHGLNYEKIQKNHRVLSQEQFFTDRKDCVFCRYLKECHICPVAAANFGSINGKIPGWLCKSQKITVDEKRIFWKEIENDSKPGKKKQI